jgi:hypothetical protein
MHGLTLPWSRAMDEFFLDLLTYTCPFTGRKRCAISAELETPMAVKKPLLVEEDAWLIQNKFLWCFKSYKTTGFFELWVFLLFVSLHPTSRSSVLEFSFACCLMSGAHWNPKKDHI